MKKKVIDNLVPILKKAPKESFYFLTSKIFLKNLAMAIALVVTLSFLTGLLLKTYTRHGSSIELPDFKGQTIDLVEKEMNKYGLRYEVLDSLYDPEKKPLTVLDQDPTPKSKVKGNRKVYLTVNASTPPLVNMPDIWGKDFDFVKKVLKARGINLNSKVEYKSDPAVNTVLKVRYNGDVLHKPKDKKNPIKLPKGAEISLVVAQGAGSDVVAPKLICQTYDEAVFTIRNSDLSVGAVINDEDLENTSAAFITKQSPPAGEDVQIGEQIDIWISAKKPDNCDEW